MIKIKVHRSYRIVVTICDSDLIGKKFEEGKMQLDIKEGFFGGEEVDKERALSIIKMQLVEDATFNIVGKESIETALEIGAITKDIISHVQGVPFALKLI